MAKRQKAKKMAQGGATKKQIKKATGFGGKTAKYFIRNYAPSQTPSQTTAPAQTTTPSPTLPKIKGVRQGLRIAGAGGISGSELKAIRKATGKSNEQLIRKLDKLNKNIRSKDKTGISLNAGAINKIVKKAVEQRSGNPMTFGKGFGTGKLGMTIAEMMGTPGSAGRYVKGQLVGAAEGTEPRRLAGGMQITPGGRERVRGFGKQYEGPGFNREDEAGDDGTTNGGGDPPAPVDPVIPEPEPEPIDTSLSSGAGGLDLASWATGFRRARSSRQRAGRRAQGTGSMKKFKFQQQFA